MRHPPSAFWIPSETWIVFSEDRSQGRTRRDVVLSNVRRFEAERVVRDINLRRRLCFGRSLFYAAPEICR